MFEVARSRSELQDVLHEAAVEPAPRAPAIDFRYETAVLLAAGPRSSTGYALEVTGVTERRVRVGILVRERSPRVGQSVAPRVTYPFVLLTIPATRKPVRPVWQGRP